MDGGREKMAAGGRWYHATRRSCVGAIRREGLRTAFHGAIHGSMEYPPVAPSVYLSRNFPPQNINTALFSNPDDPVMILEIDGRHLDPALIYPDDLLGDILDSEFLEFVEDEADIERIAPEMAAMFRLEIDKAARIMRRCMAAEDEREYPAILKDMWVEYAAAEGEIAYAGDVPAAAIGAMQPWPEAGDELEPENSPEP